MRGEAPAAANEQGEITLSGLFEFLEQTMPAWQRPHCFGVGTRLVLATYPELSAQYRDQARTKEREVTEHFLKKARERFRVRDYQEALACYDRVLEVKPDSAAASYGKARCLFELERLGERLAVYNRAIQWDPGQVSLFQDKA